MHTIFGAEMIIPMVLAGLQLAGVPVVDKLLSRIGRKGRKLFGKPEKTVPMSRTNAGMDSLL
jgi:hypothetical protein